MVRHVRSGGQTLHMPIPASHIAKDCPKRGALAGKTCRTNPFMTSGPPDGKHVARLRLCGIDPATVDGTAAHSRALAARARARAAAREEG
ncbi:amidohydrolase [Streptomyces sp. NBRC 110611]|nr:amidohydrolase [Streptomyces sp. NBRC 110611]